MADFVGSSGFGIRLLNVYELLKFNQKYGLRFQQGQPHEGVNSTSRHRGNGGDHFFPNNNCPQNVFSRTSFTIKPTLLSIGLEAQAPHELHNETVLVSSITQRDDSLLAAAIILRAIVASLVLCRLLSRCVIYGRSFVDSSAGFQDLYIVFVAYYRIRTLI